MGFSDILVILIVCGIIAGAFAIRYYRRKHGKSSCCGDCGGCNGCRGRKGK